MGGCSSKNDKKASAPGVVQGDGNQTLLAAGAGGDRKQAVDAMVAAVRQAQEPHHVDTSITMCPVFRIEPKNLQLWKAQCDTFYEAAKKQDGMLSYGFAYSEAEGSGEVHIRQCYRDASSLLAHLRAVDVPLQAALKLSQLERVEVHGLASELAQVRQEVTKFGETQMQFFETEPTAMRRPAACSGEHGSDTAVSVSHRYQVDASGTGLVKSHAAALAAHAASAPGVDQHALSTSEDGCVQLQHGYADAEAAIKHLQDSHEHRVARLERHATLERLEVHGPAAEIEKIKAFLAGASAQAGEAVADAAGAAEGAAKAAGDAAAEGAAKAKRSVEAAMASAQRAALYVLDGRAIRRSFSSTVAKVEGSVLAAEHRVEEGARSGAHSVAAGMAAAGAAVGSALSRAENAVVGEAHAAGAAASHTAHAAEAKAAAAAAAVGNAASSAEHAVAEDAHAAGAAASSAAHAAEAEAAAAVAAVGSAAASAAHTAAKDAHAAESAASNAAHAAEAKAAAAAATVGNAAANAEHVAAEDLRAAGAAASSAAHSAEAKAAAAAAAVGNAAASAEHAAVADARAAGTAVSSAAASAKDAAAADVRAAEAAMANAVDSAEGKATAAVDAISSAVASAEHTAAEDLRAAGAATSSAAQNAEAKAVATATAISNGVATAEHVVAEDVCAAGAAASSAANSAEAKAAASAGAAVAAVGAGVASAVAVVEGAVHPHHIDTTLTMCPYFKIQASNLQLWKAQCDAFYEKAKKEDGLLFYGFCFEEIDGDCEVHVRQGFKDAASLLAHLRAIDVPIQAALKLSQLERVEVHGPASELWKVQAEETTLGDAKFQFFEVEAEPLRRASPHAGDHGSDKVVSLCHYYDTKDTADAEARMRASAAKLRSEALRTPGLEHHGFAVDAAAGRAHLGQGFRGADEAIASFSRDATTHQELAQVTGKAVRLEVHGPAAELVKIRAFIVQQETNASADHGAAHATEQLRGARLFALDERALRHAYEGSVVLDLPVDQPATITLEVDVASPQRGGGGGGGWGFFTMCRGY